MMKRMYQCDTFHRDAIRSRAADACTSVLATVLTGSVQYPIEPMWLIVALVVCGNVK